MDYKIRRQNDPMPDWIYPVWARNVPFLRRGCERLWATDWWINRQQRKGYL